MTEELKIIAEIFANATDGALYAYIAYLLFNIAKVGIIVLPICSAFKFLISKMFVSKNEIK